MIARLGLVGRLLVIGIVGLGGLLLLLAGLLYVVRAQDRQIAGQFPLPRQVAAIVDLLDNTPAGDRPRLLAALSGRSVAVTVAPGPPSATPTGRELPRVENFLGRYDPRLAGRDMVADVPDETGSGHPLLEAWRGAAPLELQVALADGGHVTIAARGQPLRRLLGQSGGLWLAAGALLIAALTLYGLFRAATPLRRLTAAVESFSETASPVPVPVKGPADLRRLIARFNRMQERLSALVKGRTILAGAISHDLRTYLTRLRLRIDTIADDAERSGAERDLEAMSAIVDNALAFAQSTSGSARETIDLARIVRDEVDRHRGEGGRVELASAPPTLPLSGDAVGLHRVVANLVANALRHAGTAELSLALADGFAELLVDDTGPGIQPGEREAIFEPFYRLEPSRNRQSGGSGLGLALTRQIVEAHGGRITADAAPGGGARFRVLLPAAG